MSNIIPNLPTQPPSDYSSRDYQSIITDLINQIPSFLPEWTDRSVGDLGIVMLELFAYFGDQLHYYIDRIANEAFIATAQQPQSVLNLAQLLDYTPYGSAASTTSVVFTTVNPLPTPIVIPVGTQVTTQATGSSPPVVFTTQAALTIYGDNNTPTVQTQISNSLPSQVLSLTSAFNGTSQVVTVNGSSWTLAPSNSFTGVASTAQVYIVSGNNIVFGNGTNGAIPASGATIQVTYYPYTGSQYSASVAVSQGANITSEAMGTSTGLPNQSFNLFNSPVISGSVTVYVDQGSGPTPWNEFSRLVDAGPSDLAYTTLTQSTGVVQVSFGDGVTGVVPAAGSLITANYTVGGGSAGNVSANSIVVLPSAIAGISSVTNPTPAYGGTDPETLAHIRSHAPLSITAINRAVTVQDYAALALNQPGVAKAIAVATSSTQVTQYLHPSGGFISSSTVLSTRVAALAALVTNSTGTGTLDQRKMAYVSVYVSPPLYNNNGTLSVGYVPIDITMSVQVQPAYNQTAVVSAVQASMAALFAFDNVDFGFRVTLASIYSALLGTTGVAWGTVTALHRHELAASAPADIQCYAYEIPMLDVLNLVINPSGGLV
jgi:uncharacterized phage protein gp47/JayE